MPKKWLPDNVTQYRDRHGKPRYRFRRKGFKDHSFQAQPGTEAFRAELAAVLADKPAIGIERITLGTFDDLIARYYRSPDFLNPGERTRQIYRGAIERWRESKTPIGKVRRGSSFVKDLTAAHVETMMAELLPHRTAANMLRKRLRALMDFAVRQGMATANPVISTKLFTVDGEGFHSWTEDEISAYEARHKTGSKARLAFDLMLWTGQRRGDMRTMGPQHIRNGRITITQEKTGATVSLPILAPLAESILATPTTGLIFIMSERGAPFTKNGIGNWFRDRCNEAGLPQCSAHGLRKAASRRFAEAGCSNQQIKAWTGHTTDSEVARYTAAASQQTLSDAAAELLMEAMRVRQQARDSKDMRESNAGGSSS